MRGPIDVLFAFIIFSLPVPVPKLFGKYPTRPVPKSKTPTRRTLVMASTCSLTQVSQRAVMDNNNCRLIVIMTNVCQQNQQQQQVSVIFIQSSCMALLAVTRAAGFDNRILELGFPQLTILDFHNWQFWISTIADSQSTIVPRVSSCPSTSLCATRFSRIEYVIIIVNIV